MFGHIKHELMFQLIIWFLGTIFFLLLVRKSQPTKKNMQSHVHGLSIKYIIKIYLISNCAMQIVGQGSISTCQLKLA